MDMGEIKVNMSVLDKKKERLGLTTTEAEAVSYIPSMFLSLFNANSKVD